MPGLRVTKRKHSEIADDLETLLNLHRAHVAGWLAERFANRPEDISSEAVSGAKLKEDPEGDLSKAGSVDG